MPDLVVCSYCDGTHEVDDGIGQDGLTVWIDCPWCDENGMTTPGYVHDAGIVNDGFRKRKKRPTGWLAKAVKNGSVRDPNVSDPDAGKDYSTAAVINVPVATLDLERK